MIAPARINAAMIAMMIFIPDSSLVGQASGSQSNLLPISKQGACPVGSYRHSVLGLHVRFPNRGAIAK